MPCLLRTAERCSEEALDSVAHELDWQSGVFKGLQYRESLFQLAMDLSEVSRSQVFENVV